jgi:quercetin dioxygenase-like cupin family protein
MKRAFLVLFAGACIAAATMSTTVAQTADGHKILAAPEIKWGPGPASLPPGAEAVVLWGDPGKEGLFAMRLKLPNGYKIAPHTHPKPEVVTVISGTFRLGMGENADSAKAKALPPGSFFALSPGMAHYAFTEGETVVQLNANGPWSVNYVDPKDDPRKK